MRCSFCEFQSQNSRFKTAVLFREHGDDADGKIATANRAVSSFGSARDTSICQTARDGDAVMAGARTVDSAAINLGRPGQVPASGLKTGLAGL